jgi:hypothetical protein
MMNYFHASPGEPDSSQGVVYRLDDPLNSLKPSRTRN